MTLALSVIVCTHNPRLDYIQCTLESIRDQRSLDQQSWELIVVDNASDQPVAEHVDLSWHPAARVLVEKHLGLIHARFTGFHAASGEVLLYVDDDNVLAPDYLHQVLAVVGQAPKLGAVGGKSLPRYELPAGVVFGSWS